jgi:glutathione S-transferase
MSITLFQFKPMFGLPNPSPFCMKLETYLRLADLPHKVRGAKGLGKSPTGKAPFIEIDGAVMADSGLIINHLERTHGHPVDGKLTLAQRAESLALQRMMEEHLYWVAVYMRWVDPNTRAAWQPYLQELAGLPSWLAPLVNRMAARGIMKRVRAQGLGRHPPEVIWQMGIADIQALAHWLGNRTWGFGETPTTFDACLAAFVGNIVRTPWNNPLTAATAKHVNLVAHFERMMARCFPELAK